MIVTILDRIDQLDGIKKEWNNVYNSDKYATFNLSWPWIRAWCEARSFECIILAARNDENSQNIAFMPLSIQIKKENRFLKSSHLYTSGMPWPAHTGILCMPGYIEKVAPAFSQFIKDKIRWDTFTLRETLDPRIEDLLNCFKSKKFKIERLENTPCPHILLPDSWEKYTEESISKRAKKDIAYYVRRIKRETDFKITHINKDNFSDHIDIIMKLYALRRDSSAGRILKDFSLILNQCFKNDCLWLAILWDGETPIGGVSAFLDHKNGSFVWFNTGFDESYSKLRPGTVIFAHSIEYAISEGFRLCDFGRGDEPYKYNLGAIDRFNSNTIISKQGIKTQAQKSLIKIYPVIRKLIPL